VIKLGTKNVITDKYKEEIILRELM